MQGLRYLTGVATLSLDEERCVGCGQCEALCPHGVFHLGNGRARIVDFDGCMECGACARNCPVSAIRVTPGVGCAAYIVRAWIKGKGRSCDEASCP